MDSYQTESSATIQTVKSVATRHAEKILLAEDDREMRRLLELRLRREGYDLDSCENGFELLQHIDTFSEEKSSKFDLIISDIRMPGFTGMEILDYVNSNGGAPPVILITAFGDDETRAQAERLNVATILNKPFDLDELAKIIRRTLDTSKIADQQKRLQFGRANNSGRFPLDIFFRKYPRLSEFESYIIEASSSLNPYHADILSCRVIVNGSGHHHDSSLLEIHGLVVVPSNVIVASTGRLPNEQAENFRAAVDKFFAVLEGHMREYSRNLLSDRFPTNLAEEN